MDSSESQDDSSHHNYDDLLFRRARLSDVDSIAKIYNESIEYLDPESRDWIESIVKKRSKRLKIYVASIKDEITGFIIVYKKRGKAYIDAFAVDSRFRGRGIGQQLLSYVENVLASEGVEKIYLSVKNHNSKALGIYIKNGYKISNIVLILESLSKDVKIYDPKPDNATIRIENVKRCSFPRTKLLDTAIWSNFTWDIDEYIYRTSRENAIALTVYKGRKLLGIARLFITQNKVFVERLALSFYRPTESIKIIVHAIKMKLASQPMITITIPVDSSKSALLRTLILMGFKVVDSEYVLQKEITENHLKQGSLINALFPHIDKRTSSR